MRSGPIAIMLQACQIPPPTGLYEIQVMGENEVERGRQENSNFIHPTNSRMCVVSRRENGKTVSRRDERAIRENEKAVGKL